MPQPHPMFKPNRDKINANFEGYKLHPFPEETSLVRAALPEVRLGIQRSGNNHRMGFRELQARVRFSHLAYGFPLQNNTLGSAFYVDEDYNVVATLFDTVSRDVRFYPIAQLSKPSGAIPSYSKPDPYVPIDPQYPSIIALSPSLLLAANGHGDIAVIGFELKDGQLIGTVLDTVDYKGDGSEGVSPVPCALLAARLVAHTQKIVMVVHSRIETKETKFNIATMEIDVPSIHNDSARNLPATGLTILHIQQGLEVPVYCAISRNGDKVFLGSETRYTQLGTLPKSKPEPEQQPTSTELVTSNASRYPYQWSQDGTDLLIQFKLPKDVPKSAIHCKFASQHLVLMVRSEDTNITFPYRKLWGTVNPDGSTWTIEPATGLLSLYMEKQDDRTRWPHLFEVDDNVLETLDKSQLAEIAEKLEKFTSDSDASTFGQKVAPHPAATDMDEDIDEEGQPMVFTVHDREGTIVQEISSGSQEWICNSFYSPTGLPTVCAKHDVDGLVYKFTESNGSSLIDIDHVASLNAFAYVRASKRGSRFIGHDRHNQFAVIVESSRNAYIYYRSATGDALMEPQTLVDLTRGHDTDVLGVQLILDRVLMILTESEIIVCLL